MGSVGNEAGVRRPRLRTPTVLIGWLGALLACVLALWAVPAANLAGVRAGFGTLGSDSGPGAVAAARLCDDLADLDGQAATMLLAGDGFELAQTRAAADAAYAEDLSDAIRQLELIGSRIDAIPGGAKAFAAVGTSLNQYSQYIGAARYADGQAHGQAPAAPPADALASYQAGSKLMHLTGSGLLAQAQVLLAAADGTVQSGYDGQLATIGQLRVWTVLLTILVVLALVVAQIGLHRRFKRRISPPLALAAVLTLIFSVLLMSALSAAHADSMHQKADAYDSVVNLWRGRAVAADMNASQSRYLLDAAAGTASGRAGMSAEQALFDAAELQTVAEQVIGVYDSYDLYRTDLDAQAKDLGNGAGAGFSAGHSDIDMGILGRELANAAFPGERTAASSAFRAYTRLVDDDADFRDLATRSQPGAAAAQYLTGTLDADYTAYTKAIDGTLSVDEQQFTAAAARGGQDLGPWLWMPAGWALAAGALVLLGFVPRLREYRRS